MCIRDRTKTTPQKKETEPETQHKQGPDSLKKAEPQHREATRENAHVNNAKKAENTNEEKETPVVDMRKKVMRKSYKAVSYTHLHRLQILITMEKRKV